MSRCAVNGTERSFLERSVPWWHVSFAVVLGVTTLINMLVPETMSRRLPALALLGLIALLYVLFGRRMFMVMQARPLDAVLYLVPLGAAVCALVAISPNGSYLLFFIVFPHIWALLRVRLAIAASVVFVLAIVLIQIAGVEEFPADVWGPVASGVFMLALAVLMGVWLSGIIAESERRQALIVELEGTRAELADSHHREGVLAERQRLAAEIHDTLAQGFMSILVLSRAPSTPERMAKIERTARENLAEARSLIEALGPGELRDSTLADACRRVVERFDAEADGIAATFTLDGTPRPLSVNNEIVLLRAAQEALANVRKHAFASHVAVCLSYSADGTTIRIRDDGIGFDAAEPTEGFGLRGMRSRAEQVAGTVHVRSAPRGGTVVEVRVP